MEAVRAHCNAACRTDKSREGVILKISGKELKKLGCPICADWNYNFKCIRTWDNIRLDVDYDAEYLSIIVNNDVAFEYLKIFKKMPFKDES